MRAQGDSSENRHSTIDVSHESLPESAYGAPFDGPVVGPEPEAIANSSAQATKDFDVSAEDWQWYQEISSVINNSQIEASMEAAEDDSVLQAEVAKAKRMIAMIGFPKNAQYNRIDIGTVAKPVTGTVAKVLSSFLDHAEECGGHKGLAYTAAAICACEGEETLQKLQRLGSTWVSHFLRMCEC